MREDERERRETRREQQRSEAGGEKRKHEGERDAEIHLANPLAIWCFASTQICTFMDTQIFVCSLKMPAGRERREGKREGGWGSLLRLLVLKLWAET